MKITLRAFLQSTLVLSLAAGPLVQDAVAASTTVVTTFGGTVKGTGSTFPANVMAGDAIGNSYFSYNPGNFTPNGTGVYTFTGASSNQAFSLTVLTPVPVGGFTASQWSDSYGGSNGVTPMYTITMTAPVGSSTTTPTVGTTTMDVHVTTTGGTGVTKPGSFFDLVLTSTTYTGGTALPTATVAGPSTTDISSFLTTKATLVWDPSAADGTAQDFTADITNFNGVDVPEPSSLVLAIVGMATCTGGFLISRRKAAGALQSGRIAS